MKVTVISKENGVLICEQVASLKVAEILVNRYKKRDNRFCIVRVICDEWTGLQLPSTFDQIYNKDGQAIYEMAR